MEREFDPRVDAYIAKSGDFARPILVHVRQLIHRNCPGITETIKWRFPNFQLNGKLFCGMAAFKAHCSFGFWHKGMQQLIVADGRKSDEAMGSLGRLATKADLPDDATMRRYLRHAVGLQESGVPSRPRSATKRPELPVPPDLAAALKKNKKAAATFTASAPSHRREYIEWITEAKRDETRQKRVATALEWLAAGKQRNWKYANC